jgi:hypothetical protein
VASQQAQKKELELKHLNALKTFDEVRDSFVCNGHLQAMMMILLLFLQKQNLENN